MNKKQKQELYELKKKSTTTAVILGLLINGAGQMYAGKVGIGILTLIGAMIAFALLGFIGSIIIGLLGVIDAYQTVVKHNKMLKIELDL